MDAPTKRLVRLEKDSYTDDIALAKQSRSPFLIDANALVKQRQALRRVEQFAKDGKQGAAKLQRDAAAKFQTSLDVAVNGPSKQRDALMQQHMKSSASSPFLSGTPSFTTGENSQLSYMAANLKRGETQIATIHQSARAMDNPHNTREQEVLIPHGERLNERIGVLHVTPMGKSVRPWFIDKTGEKPKLYTGRKAVMRFKELSQK